MKTVLMIAFISFACIVAYHIGFTAGKRTLLYSQVSCLLAIEEVCKNPKEICKNNNSK